MRVIYIAGPYRDNRGEFFVRRNIATAEREAVFVWSIGAAALCPHKNSGGLGGAAALPDETWLAGGLELLYRCDAVYMIEGWQASAGSRDEMKFAQAHNIPVLLSREDVMNFMRQPLIERK